MYARMYLYICTDKATSWVMESSGARWVWVGGCGVVMVVVLVGRMDQPSSKPASLLVSLAASWPINPSVYVHVYVYVSVYVY